MGYPSDQSNETSVRLDLNPIITASSVLVFVHGCTRASPASLNHPRGCSGHPRSSRRTVPRHTCFQKPPEQHLSCLLSKLELAQELGQMLFSAGALVGLARHLHETQIAAAFGVSTSRSFLCAWTSALWASKPARPNVQLRNTRPCPAPVCTRHPATKQAGQKVSDTTSPVPCPSLMQVLGAT